MPSFSDYGELLWHHRPLWAGGTMNLIPDSAEELAADFYWHAGSAIALHSAQKLAGGTGFGPSRFVNIAGGELAGLFRPGQVTHVGRHTVVRGSAMSLTEAAWFHRWRLLRAAGSVARFVNPVATVAWIGYELYQARDDPVRHPHTTQLKYGIEQQLASGNA